jgi:Amino acid synthesis
LPDFPVRRITLQIEDILHEGGPVGLRQRGAIMAAVTNPFAGHHAPDLQAAMEDLKPLGLMLTDRLIAALGGRDGIDGYGKGALVGEAGEAEHGALWHVPGGYAMRERLGESRAIVPSAMKAAAMGGSLDVPLGHINAAYVRSHFDAMTVCVPDAPRANEIVFVLAMAKGPRIHSRMGGLEAWDVIGTDGLR